MKITFTAWLSMASTKTVCFWFTKFTKGKTHKLILLPETISLSGGVIQERFSHFSNNQFFRQTNCQKTLSVRKNLTLNTNVGQTSHVNLNKFGIGSNIPVIVHWHCPQTIGLKWPSPRLNFTHCPQQQMNTF